MDLILLQPGDPAFFSGQRSDWAQGSSLIDGQPFSSLNVEQCIELVSLHQGLQQLGRAAPGDTGHAGGQPVISELGCVKYLDKTSVKLYDHCLRAEPLGKGKEHPTMLYVARNSGDQTANILTIALRDALVTEIQLQSHPDDMPTEQFKLNCTEILWTCNIHIQKADTVPAGKVSAGWSFVHNRAITQFT